MSQQAPPTARPPPATAPNGDPNTRPSAADLPPANTALPSKKTKNKKSADPVNTYQAIQDTMKQLEQSKAGDREQEIEIEREVRKANRELSNLLSSLETPMSRLDTVQRKYSDLLAEMKRTEREYQRSKKRADQLQKEKDTNRSELTKMTIVKDKLEKLCRELQKDNKKLKDDNKRLYDNETRMREELHERLEGMVLDVQDLIDSQENPENSPANAESDELFRAKFKSFIEQYELREIQFQSVLRMKELEVQYQLARYESQRKAQEQEASKSRQLTTQVSTFSQTETELRSQLNIYVEKFKQVEDTLNNSNDLFLTFRKEMEEMSKKTKRLEKENHNLTRKHDLTSHNILQMAEERQKASKEIEGLKKRNENLEKLCRGMQMQGRGRAQDVAPGSSPNNPTHQQADAHLQHNGTDAEESEYDDDEEEEDDDEDDDEDDEDDEDGDEDGVSGEGDVSDSDETSSDFDPSNSPRPPHLTTHEFQLWQASHFPDHAPFRRSRGPNTDPVNNPQNFVRNRGTPGTTLRITNLQPNVSPTELQNLLETTGAKVTHIVILPELGPMLQYRNRELGLEVQWQIAFVSFETVAEAEGCFVMEDRLVGPRGNTSQIRIDYADAEVPPSQQQRRRREEGGGGGVNGEGSSGQREDGEEKIASF